MEKYCYSETSASLKFDTNLFCASQTFNFYLLKMGRFIKRTRRAPRIKTVIRPGCVICKQSQCIDEIAPEVMCRINPDIYDGAITRSLSKLIDSIQNFIIIETYRCMPLLGDEQEKVPDWDVHIVRYSIVFVKHTTSN